MNKEQIEKNYQEARKECAEFGIDTEKAIERVAKIPVSVHCWQGDDVLGFDGSDSLAGGIQTTGNYKGRARTPAELRADIKEAFFLRPGVKRLNLHASYAFLGKDKGKVDRDEYTIDYFKPWIEFGKEIGLAGLDFNPTYFSHPMVKDNLTLSSPNEKVREFWVRHGISCLKITEEFGKAFHTQSLMDIWIPDGYKDVPADRLNPRLRLKKSLDEILSYPYDKKYVLPAVESKTFGIGLESFTVGSNEFYQNYAASNHISCLRDRGHYHPTEYVSDKISALLAFHDKVALHVSRPVRWDSDHVVLFDDELKEVAKEIIRNNADQRVIIGLDYFDASINRIIAWVTGERSRQKALLYAATLPNEERKTLQDEADFSKLRFLQERAKRLPFSAIWQEYLLRQGLEEDYYTEAIRYENDVLSKRR